VINVRNEKDLERSAYYFTYLKVLSRGSPGETAESHPRYLVIEPKFQTIAPNISRALLVRQPARLLHLLSAQTAASIFCGVLPGLSSHKSK
jgi:hypothetical protein